MPSLATKNLMRARLRLRFFAETSEDAGDGLRLGQDLLFGCEFAQHLGLVGNGPEAAADIDLEAPLLLAVDLAHLGEITEVMHHDETAGLAFATGERRFELAPEVLHVVVAEQELGKGLRVRRGIENFGLADAGQVAAGYVADRVAAGLACGDADGG